MSRLSELILVRLEALGLSTAEFVAICVAELGVCRATPYNWIKTGGPPRISRWAGLARVLQVPVRTVSEAVQLDVEGAA